MVKSELYTQVLLSMHKQSLNDISCSISELNIAIGNFYLGNMKRNIYLSSFGCMLQSMYWCYLSLKNQHWIGQAAIW